MPLLAAWQERRRERKFQIAVENRAKKLERRGLLSAQERTPPPHRTKWTRRVPHPVLVVHV